MSSKSLQLLELINGKQSLCVQFGLDLPSPHYFSERKSPLEMVDDYIGLFGFLFEKGAYSLQEIQDLLHPLNAPAMDYSVGPPIQSTDAVCACCDDSPHSFLEPVDSGGITSSNCHRNKASITVPRLISENRSLTIYDSGYICDVFNGQLEHSADMAFGGVRSSPELVA